MAVNLFEKFSPKVAERFFKKSVTAGVASKAYDWDGVDTIKVASVGTVPLGNYTRSGTARYGNPAELNDSLQTMKLSQDKAATYTIDKGNDKEQYNIKNANRSLQRELDEVVTPTEDIYALKQWAGAAGSVVHAGAVNASTVISEIGKLKYALDQAKAPAGGRFLYVTNEIANLISDSSQFVYTDALANKAMIEGEIGKVKGFRVIPVLDDYLPTGVRMLACHTEALLNPFKLREYKIHTDPPGINGSLVELRVLYDAFVLDAKAGAVCAYANTANIAGNASIAVAANVGNFQFTGDKLIYTLDGTDPRCSDTVEEITANSNTVNCAGATKVRAVVYDANKAVMYGKEATLTI